MLLRIWTRGVPKARLPEDDWDAAKANIRVHMTFARGQLINFLKTNKEVLGIEETYLSDFIEIITSREHAQQPHMRYLTISIFALVINAEREIHIPYSLFDHPFLKQPVITDILEKLIAWSIQTNSPYPQNTQMLPLCKDISEKLVIWTVSTIPLDSLSEEMLHFLDHQLLNILKRWAGNHVESQIIPGEIPLILQTRQSILTAM